MEAMIGHKPYFPCKEKASRFIFSLTQGGNWGTCLPILSLSDDSQLNRIRSRVPSFARERSWRAWIAEKVLKQNPYCGHLFVFRGRRGDLIKVIWCDGQGACLFSKRLEKGKFVWPAAKDGRLALTPAQLSMLLEGIDWRTPQRTWRPLTAG